MQCRKHGFEGRFQGGGRVEAFWSSPGLSSRHTCAKERLQESVGSTDRLQESVGSSPPRPVEGTDMNLRGERRTEGMNIKV